jgi:hypothetical protein
VTNRLRGRLVTLVTRNNFDKNEDDTNVTPLPQRGGSHIRNMEFQNGLHESVTNVTNPPRRGLVTLVTRNYFDQNEDFTNVSDSLGGRLVTLVTPSFRSI